MLSSFPELQQAQGQFAAAVLHYEDGQFEKAHDLFAELAASAAFPMRASACVARRNASPVRSRSASRTISGSAH